MRQRKRKCVREDEDPAEVESARYAGVGLCTGAAGREKARAGDALYQGWQAGTALTVVAERRALGRRVRAMEPRGVKPLERPRGACLRR